MNLFSGLEGLGLGKLTNDLDVYDDQKKKEIVSMKNSAKEEVRVQEKDILFDKSHKCPICDKEFTSKTVRAGKLKASSQDSDLRPVYEVMDPLKYDATVCPRCGFSAINRFFGPVSSMQMKQIKAQVSQNFSGIPEEKEVYTYDDAILRHKLALVCTVVKKSKNSERAYTCLKLAWLLRGKSLEITNEKEKKTCNQEEKEFLLKAYEGFLGAFSKETFPMCGMDENTLTYLMSDLARRLGKYDEALKWTDKILSSRSGSDRLREKAREVREKCREELQKK